MGHIISLDLWLLSGIGQRCGEKGHSIYMRTGSSLGAALVGLIPTNAHPGIGLPRVILSECGHSIGLVNIKADFQVPRLLQQPEDRVRNLRKPLGLSSFLSMPPFPSPSSKKQPVQGN